MGKESKDIGTAGEDFACGYLKDLGWQVLERNFRSYHGEIDIIAKHKDIIVFVEVKNYSFRSYYPPVYSIRASKKQCMIHTAKYYLTKNRINDVNCRFDVLTIFVTFSGERKTEHYENAFQIN